MCQGIKLAQKVGYVDAKCHLDTFECVERKQSQFLVENIESYRILKTASGDEIAATHGVFWS